MFKVADIITTMDSISLNLAQPNHSENIKEDSSKIKSIDIL